MRAAFSAWQSVVCLAVVLVMAPGRTASGQIWGPGGIIDKLKEDLICLTAEKKEVDIALKNGQLGMIRLEMETLQRNISDMRERRKDLEDNIKHYNDVINGKAELTEQETAAHVVPAAAKVDARNAIDELDRDITDEKKKLEEKRKELVTASGEMQVLEKIKVCRAVSGGGAVPPAPGTGQTTETPPAGTPAQVGGCKNAADAELLAEYRRIIAFYEKENKDIDGRLATLDVDIGNTLRDTRIDDDVRKIRLEEYNKQKSSQTERKKANQVAIDEKTAAVNAILKKQPCPLSPPRTATPQSPTHTPGTPENRKGKRLEVTKTAKRTPTSRTARRNGPPEETRTSVDTPRAVLDIGFGISRGGGDRERRDGGGYRQRREDGGGFRQMSPGLR